MGDYYLHVSLGGGVTGQGSHYSLPACLALTAVVSSLATVPLTSAGPAGQCFFSLLTSGCRLLFLSGLAPS